ncbi:hypothetical protein K491DRAFT_717795 [Lophiostoma macrostomum CBS 122681]|uniref:S-adenosyl-L-methionine-dependent methyltransferase n=1 Tax=Lophiostoma macrostomum CBS 122681 TaxID=1314788 RepID=A0A6A6T219_9PLEO|nr:hypothetical protein K491DRAFT_717795 [Lophiostoma macrostomum CBS 122681]
MTNIKKNYVFSYGFAESGRLHLQHWLWNMQLGWDRHPAIDLSGSGEIWIADLGCGNGAWLLSLARSFENVQDQEIVLRGFDIASSHFPAPENLPNNITLGVMDAFTTDLPASLVGKFDVVHVRAFAAVVKNNNPGVEISNACKLLKPGGYLQWDEVDAESTRAVSPRETVCSRATQALLDNAKLSSKVAMNLQYAWISDLGKIFKTHGLELVTFTRMDVKKELWNDAGDEIEEGISVVMDLVVCVGRKPL